MLELAKLLSLPPETLIPVKWVREHLIPEPNPLLVQLGVAIEVASSYWAGVIEGEFPLPLSRPGRIKHDAQNINHAPVQDMARRKWTEKFGDKGRSRVTIFNRPKVSPFIYIEWWKDGRRLTRRLTVNGAPVPDEEEARRVAREVARATVDKLEEKAKRDFWMSIAARPGDIPEAARELLSEFVSLPPSPPQVGSPGVEVAASVLRSGTVEALFDRWLESQKKDKKTKRIAARQWKEALGPSTVLKTLTPDVVNRKALALSRSKGWADKTLANRVRHLQMALEYARSYLEWEGPNPKRIEVPELELPDTEHLTYSATEYDAILQTALEVARSGPSANGHEDVDSDAYPTACEALRVGAAVAITATFARRIEQTLSLTTTQVTKTKLLGNVDALEFSFPRPTEKAKRFKDAKNTVATLNRVQHPLEYRIVESLLTCRGVETSGLLFPSVPHGSSLSDKLPPVRVTQDTMREYLLKVEAAAAVPSVPKRAYHGLKRFSATQCETPDDLQHLAKLSNTSESTLLRYHKKLGTFVNRNTRRSEEERLRAELEENNEASG